MSDDLSRSEVEKLIDERVEGLQQQLTRNQRMLNSLQDEVEQLRDRAGATSDEKRGNRRSIKLEERVMKAVAEEVQGSRRNVADRDAVINRVQQHHDELKSVIGIKIDNLVEDDFLIRQPSGDLVPKDEDMEELAFVEDYYSEKLDS